MCRYEDYKERIELFYSVVFPAGLRAALARDFCPGGNRRIEGLPELSAEDVDAVGREVVSEVLDRHEHVRELTVDAEPQRTAWTMGVFNAISRAMFNYLEGFVWEELFEARGLDHQQALEALEQLLGESLEDGVDPAEGMTEGQLIRRDLMASFVPPEYRQEESIHHLVDVIFGAFAQEEREKLQRMLPRERDGYYCRIHAARVFYDLYAKAFVEHEQALDFDRALKDVESDLSRRLSTDGGSGD